MKQVFLTGNGGIALLDAPVPGKLNNSILVRNHYSLISSGTEGAAITKHTGLMGLYEKALSSRDRMGQVWAMAEAHGIRQTVNVVRNKLSDFTALGYSSVGTVVDVSDADMPFRVGDSVACMGTGFASHSEFVVVPRNLAARIPEGAQLDQAAFAALACIAMQGIRRLELTAGERVGVVGLGLIGQISLRLLASMGYRAYGLDLSEERAAIARKFANTEAWALDKLDSEAHVLDLTDGIGLDGVIVCAASDSDEPVNLAFDICRRAGRVSIVGDVGLALQRKKMYAKELDVRMSCSYGKGRYDVAYEIDGVDYDLDHVRWSEGRNLEHFLWLLGTGALDLSDLISDRFPIDDVVNAYAKIKGGDSRVLGVLLDYGDPTNCTNSVKAAAEGTRIDRSLTSAVAIGERGNGPVRLGIIGAGGYVTGMHLPLLKDMGDEFLVRALVSRSGATAAAAAKRFDVPTTASDYRRILDDPEIDAVMIATRHATHAKFAIEAIEAGKHVFVEKPMATTVADAEDIVAAADRSGLIVRVGFNRRFSPYIHALRDVIGPEGIRVLFARVNVGAIKNDWSNTPEEGGRLLGEGVHFFDLANWFMGAEPKNVAANMIGTINSTNANASVLLRYTDGSNANVLYTSLGDKRMGKEYFEAFGNGRSAILNDYNKLEIWGGNQKSKPRRGDKGQRDCLREFSAAVRGIEFPVKGADARAGLAATRIAQTILNDST